MSEKKGKLLTERSKRALDQIRPLIRPGDIITQIGYNPWWQLWSTFIHWAIQYHQRRLLGKNAEWRATHAMLYLDEEHTFSVETPKAVYRSLESYCLYDIFIYRLRLLDEFTVEHIHKMQEAIDGMLGENYDYGQALDIFINKILGYDQQRRRSFFDMGRSRKVCSVGVRVAFEYLYQHLIRQPDSRPGKWLFYKLNDTKWPENAVLEYQGTDVEATVPAHFANSELFAGEIEFIAHFKNGVRQPA